MALSDEVTFFPKSVAWNSNTWNNTSGGLQNVEFGESSTTVDFKSGVDIYSTIVAEVERMPTCRVILSEALPITFSTEKGKKATMTIVFQGATSSDTTTITYVNAKLIDVQSRQSRATASECVLSFVYESADGSTPPITLGS